LLASLPSQVKKSSGERDGDAVCPWCKNDPALMSAAGVISHGPLAIAARGSADMVATLPASQWIFLETAHLRWASCLGEDTVDQRDRERVDGELARLRVALPAIPVRPKKLDPWLRMHLQAMKGEDLYARFQKILGVTDADFPDARQVDQPYMGNGRFLGEKDKYEIVIHATRANHVRFTQSFSGVAVEGAFRWHFKELQKLIVSVPAEDADLREDRWLFPHIAHNLSHVFFCGYKHFSYDPPAWLDEGLAQALEKEIEPQSRTTEGEEGSMRDAKGPADYPAAALKLVTAGKQKRLAELMNAKDFSELGSDGDVCAWSMVRFLIDAQAEPCAKFLGGIKGQLNAQGIATGADLPDLERRLLKELWGWTPADFDTAWTAWVRAKQ
jgi:hypothetical protein